MSDLFEKSRVSARTSFSAEFSQKVNELGNEIVRAVVQTNKDNFTQTALQYAYDIIDSYGPMDFSKFNSFRDERLKTTLSFNKLLFSYERLREYLRKMIADNQIDISKLQFIFSSEVRDNLDIVYLNNAERNDFSITPYKFLFLPSGFSLSDNKIVTLSEANVPLFKDGASSFFNDYSLNRYLLRESDDRLVGYNKRGVVFDKRKLYSNREKIVKLDFKSH